MAPGNNTINSRIQTVFYAHETKDQVFNTKPKLSIVWYSDIRVGIQTTAGSLQVGRLTSSSISSGNLLLA